MSSNLPPFDQFVFPESGRQYSEQSQRHYLDMARVLSDAIVPRCIHTKRPTSDLQGRLITCLSTGDFNWPVTLVELTATRKKQPYAANSRISMVRTLLCMIDHLHEHKVIEDPDRIKGPLLRHKELLDASVLMNKEPKELYTIQELQKKAERLAYGSEASILLKMHLLIPCRDDLWLWVFPANLSDESSWNSLSYETDPLTHFNRVPGTIDNSCWIGEFDGSWSPSNFLLVDFTICRAVVVIRKSKTVRSEAAARFYRVPVDLFNELLFHMSNGSGTGRYLFQRQNYKKLKAALAAIGISQKGQVVDLVRSAHAFTAKLSGSAEQVAKVAYDSMHSVKTSETYLS